MLAGIKGSRVRSQNCPSKTCPANVLRARSAAGNRCMLKGILHSDISLRLLNVLAIGQPPLLRRLEIQYIKLLAGKLVERAECAFPDVEVRV